MLLTTGNEMWNQVCNRLFQLWYQYNLLSDFDEVIKIIQLVKRSNTKSNYKGTGNYYIKLISSQKELLLLRKMSSICTYVTGILQMLVSIVESALSNSLSLIVGIRIYNSSGLQDFLGRKCQINNAIFPDQHQAEAGPEETWGSHCFSLGRPFRGPSIYLHPSSSGLPHPHPGRGNQERFCL